MTYDKKKKTKYRILGLVGRGQFGRVYCGCHRRTGQIVALKDLDRHRFPTHQFLRELRFLLQLTHPHIVTCHALEHTQTGRYLVMDYCEGGTLRSLMEAEMPRLEISLKLIADVLAGLEHAHSHGIVHCDIKPENILLQVVPGGWTARISDFGIARLSQELHQGAGNTGSPAYMAPERFYGQYSIASDLYAVGVLMFELLASYRPFSGAPLDLMTAHLNQPVKLPPEIPTALHKVILTALQKLPARRYRSAAQMLEALQEAQAALKLQGEPSRMTSALCPWRTIRTEQFESPVEDVAIAPQHRYLALGNRITCQSWTQEPLSTTEENPDALIEVQTLTPIKRLVVKGARCWLMSHHKVYFLADPTQLSASSQLEAIAKFEHPDLMDVADNCQWLAVVAGQSLHLLSGSGFAQMRVCALRNAVEHLLILDSGHLALLSSHLQGTRLEVRTRKGIQIGSWLLPVRFAQVTLGSEPYRLVAIEDNEVPSLLLLDLKPFRLRRLGVDIANIKHLAVTRWGYILANQSGEIEFLGEEGSKVGRLQVPGIVGEMRLEAIAVFEETGLMGVVRDNQQSCIYTLDLRQLELSLVF